MKDFSDSGCRQTPGCQLLLGSHSYRRGTIFELLQSAMTYMYGMVPYRPARETHYYVMVEAMHLAAIIKSCSDGMSTNNASGSHAITCILNYSSITRKI